MFKSRKGIFFGSKDNFNVQMLEKRQDGNKRKEETILKDCCHPMRLEQGLAISDLKFKTVK